MNHVMKLEETYKDHPKYKDGSERWKCPICNREFVLSYPPNYKKIILNEGDSNASHSGGKGGLKMGSLVGEKLSGLSDIWTNFIDRLF